jgi:hypothetical protein
MSDEPFLGRPRLMTAEAARDIARLYRALEDSFTETGDPRAANRAHRDSQWWLTYALALSQTNSDPT